MTTTGAHTSRMINATAPITIGGVRGTAGVFQPKGFEQLLATKCGANGTLLLGIDRDTQSGYLYAVSHAN